MAKYAQNTTVSPEKSLAEIQATLKRYGATKFGFMEDDANIILVFEMQNRRVKFRVPLPDLTDFEAQRVRLNKYATRPATPQEKAATRDQVVHQRWRALLLVIKAKLESVESGIETLDQAFMAHLVLPSGETLGDWATPQIERAYLSGQMPPLMIASGS